MIKLEGFHEYFLQSVLSDSQSRGLLQSKAFFENVCEELISIGDLTKNYTEAEYSKKDIPIVYGYDYDEERLILTLLVDQFFQEEEIQTLYKKDVDVKFNRLKNFFIDCSNGLYEKMEEAYEHSSMAYHIYQLYSKNKIEKIRLVILSDGKATASLQELPLEIISGIQVEYRIIDIHYLYKVYLSENSGGDFDIDINIPCLKISTLSDEYESYLSYLSGDAIFDIYELFGQKLFEQNVRTFLQFRGNVNKGLKNTIEYNPDMFFAYNNGITATASAVELDENGNIVKIKNFQIVNGGQTTSSIYASHKNSNLDVSKISVQMKLSVVKDINKQGDFVSKVSEYANTQNKIEKSDFFSNSPFHKEFKQYSKSTWVAAVTGSQRRTHWFYERVKGEYLNEQAYFTKSEQKQFELENPKNQKIEKTSLSKSENSWLQIPYIVAKGKQDSFAYFAKNITNQLEEDNLFITESYFKDSICRVILFNEVEKMISAANWYKIHKSYRAQAVTYSISYLSYLIEQKKKYLNFNLIWEEQKLPVKLNELLKELTEKVFEFLINPPEGNLNISQWCKKILCWENLQESGISVVIDEELLISSEDEKYTKKEEKKSKKLDSSIEIESFVIRLEKEKWKELLSYYSKEESRFSISQMQLDVLNKYSIGHLIIPSPKQSKVLYQLYDNALDEGFVFE